MATRKDMEEEMARGFAPNENITNPAHQQARAQEFMVLYLERIDKKLAKLLDLMEKRQED